MKPRYLIVTGLTVFTALVLFALAAPLFGSPLAISSDGLTTLGLPLGIGARGHPLGTDILGRDMLARTAYGLRTTLEFTLLANAASVGTGTVVGLAAGFYRGRVEQILMRLVDVFLSVPTVVSGLALASIVGHGVTGIVVIVTALYWAWTARLVHGEALRLRRQPFVEAALVHGVRPRTAIVRHVLPNIRTLLLNVSALNGAAVVVVGSGLSYLGAGIAAPRPELGNLLQDGTNSLSYDPQLLLIPMVFVIALVLCFVLVGEGINRTAPESERRSWLNI